MKEDTVNNYTADRVLLNTAELTAEVDKLWKAIGKLREKTKRILSREEIKEIIERIEESEEIRNE